MAEKDTEHEQKEIIEAVPEEIDKLEKEIKTIKEELPAEKEDDELSEEEFRKLSPEKKREIRETKAQKIALENWIPKTQLGKLVKHGKIKDLDDVLERGKKILEPEIVDTLLPELKSDLILIGQAKGKFGGGKRRAWRQTQKKTKEGNILSFSCMAVVGDGKNHIGIGTGKAKETLPSREKALRNAKLNIMRIERGFESPQNEKDSTDPHTVPYTVEGKSSSAKVKLIPAPRGTGLVVADECKKVLKLAGIKDVYSRTKGQTKISFNLVKACINALSKTNKLRL